MTARNCSGGVIDTNSTSAKTADFSRQSPIAHSLFLSWYSGKRSEITCSNLAGFCLALLFCPLFFYLFVHCMIWIHHCSYQMRMRQFIITVLRYWPNISYIYLEICMICWRFFYTYFKTDLLVFRLYK